MDDNVHKVAAKKYIQGTDKKNTTKNIDMNTIKMDRIPITYYLQKNGYTPVYTNPNKAIYKSPLNTGKSSQLIIDRKNNTWTDTRSKANGSLTELIAKMNNTGLIGTLLLVQLG